MFAGLTKIGHAADLAAAITAYRLGLPPPVVAATALALPPFEMLLGFYLIAGLLPRVASSVAVAMLALFSSIVALAVIRGLSAPCGCFGPGDNSPATWLTVLRDASFLLPALYLVHAQLPFAGRRRSLVKEHLGEVRAGREEKHRLGLAPGIDVHPGQLLAIGDVDDPKRYQL